MASGAWTVWLTLTLEAAYAQAEDGAPGLAQGDPGSIYWMLFKVVLFLIAIIGIFLLIMKAVSQKNSLFQSGRSIKSLGGLGLGQNKSIQVVQIGNRLYVLGVGHDVNLVVEIDDPEEIRYIVEHFHAGSGVELKGFKFLEKLVKRRAADGDQSQELDVTPSFQAVFQEKMHRMANRQQKLEELINEDHEINNDRLNDKP